MGAPSCTIGGASGPPSPPDSYSIVTYNSTSGDTEDLVEVGINSIANSLELLMGDVLRPREI